MSYYFSHEGLIDTYRVKGAAEVSELDLFSPLSMQTSIDNAFYETLYCGEGNLNPTVPDVTFIAKGQNNLIDLNESYMSMTCRLLKIEADGSGKPPAATEIVGATDLTMYAIWSDLVLYINGKQVNNSFHLYHLQSYLQLLTNMSSDALKKWRVSGYWGDKNLTQVAPNLDKGDPIILARYNAWKGGAKVSMIGPLLSSGVTQIARLVLSSATPLPPSPPPPPPPPKKKCKYKYE